MTTTATPIAVEGGICSGTSAGGALYDATHGDWQAKDVASEGVQIDGIDGLNFPSFSEIPDAYWSFWLNSEFAQQGACAQEVENGADIVFAAQCDAIGSNCPTSASTPDHFLTSTAPTETVVQVGASVSVTVGSISTATGVREASLPENVTVTAGSVVAGPNADGVATLSFPSAGTYTLQAHAPDSVPSDQYTICVHNGNDGNCGTQKSSTATGSTGSGSPVIGAASAGAPYKGPYALVAKASSVTEGHVYKRGDAPRILSGSVLAHTTVTATSLELRREYRGRCYAYDGVTTRFARTHCGEGSFFKVSNNGVFSYLLPAALPPGRYVLDIEATDAAGNRTTPSRGTTRIVFYVR